MKCRCVGNGAVDVIGLCDTSKIDFSECDEAVSSTEISIPEMLTIPCEKPCIESIDKVFVDIKIISKRMVKTPAALDDEGNLVPNEEGTFLTGSKLVVEGILCQKIVYTADLPEQSVHSAHFKIPFSVFIMLPLGTNVDEDKFCVDVCIEDVFVKQIGPKQIFKNVTVFFRAKPLPLCNAEQTDPPEIDPIEVGDEEVTGTAEPGSLIILCLNGVPQTPVLADENGDWSVPVPPIEATDEIRVTAKAPGKTVSDPTIISGQTADPVITLAATAGVVVQGTSEPSATVTVIINAGTPITTTADLAGNWSVAVAALANGDIIDVTAETDGKLVSNVVQGIVPIP